MDSFKRIAISVLKFSLPVLIIGWLLSNISTQEWQEISARPKQWGRLTLAFVLVLGGVGGTCVRWFFLVRTLGLPFRVRDALRLGFLGYLLNFVSIGAVGGDLFKAVFIAREQSNRRAKAVASVIADRVIGLYALLLLGSGAILMGDVLTRSDEVKLIGQVTLSITAIGAILGLLFALLTVEKFTAPLGWLPLNIGRMVLRLVESLVLYRHKPGSVAAALGISLVTHTMFVSALYLIASGILQVAPSLGEHFVLGPLAMVAGAVPLMPAGLGALEFALDLLYVEVPTPGLAPGRGVLVALGYRLITIGVAGVGIVIYWVSKREVRQLLVTEQRAQVDGQM